MFRLLARDLGHPLVKHPSREEWKALPAGTPYWIHSNYTIDRPSTASAVVVQGVRPGQDPVYTTLWVALGEPVTTMAVPLWFAAGVPPDEVWKGKDAPIAAEAFRLKDVLRPLKTKERGEYFDVTRLDNASGTGWLPTLLDAERGIFAETKEAFLKKKPSAQELAAFQKAMAGRALGVLKGIEAKPRPVDTRGASGACRGGNGRVARNRRDPWSCPGRTRVDRPRGHVSDAALRRDGRSSPRRSVGTDATPGQSYAARHIPVP